MSIQTYQLSYATINNYHPPVRGGQFLFLLIPCEDASQSVHDLALKNSLDEPMSFMENAFGFTTLFLASRKSFGSLELDMMCRVRKDESNPFDFISPIAAEEEHRQLTSLEFRVEHQPFLRNNERTRLEAEQHPDALPSLQAGERVFDYLVELNSALHRAMTFQTGITDTLTTAREAWKARQGVCQDYAHIMLGVVRRQGIPTRYVSGYLSQGAAFAGDSQMHAWVEAFVPGLGWKGFDPSNDLLVDHHYIKVAHGIDYEDCPPIRGVVQATLQQETQYRVQVIPQ